MGMGSGLTKKAPQIKASPEKAPQSNEVSMKDFQDLMGQNFKSNAMAEFE